MSADGELNIVPFLDVVVNLMLFLLATTTAAVAVAQVDTQLVPQRRVGGAPPEGLTLSVTIADRGIIVASREGRFASGCERTGAEPLTITRAPSGYDFAALQRCLERVHARHPGEDTVIVTADPRVPYEDLISAMDAARGSAEAPLFPRVLLSAGIR